MSRNPTRQCRICGAPSDKRSLCSRCSPTRATGQHIDKYALRDKPSQQPQKTIAQLEQEILARKRGSSARSSASN
jgi:hypothetical protein